MSVLAHLPIRDSKLIQRKFLELTPGAWVIGVWCAIPYVYLARQFGLELFEYVAALAMLSFHIVTALCAAVFAFFFAPVNPRWRLWWGLIGIAIVVACLFVGMSAHELNAAGAAAISTVLYILPWGWVSAGYLHGFLQGDALGLWWLAAACAFVLFVLLLVVVQIRAGFSIKEYIISPVNGQWYGVIEKGFRVPRTLPPPPPLDGRRIQQQPEQVELLTAQGADQQVIGAASLLQEQPSNERILDRACNRLLSARERAILSAWSSSFGRLTIQWWYLLGFLAFIAIFSLFAFRKENRLAGEGAALVTQTWAAFALFYSRFSGAKDVRVGWANLLTLYPIGFDEVCWVGLKREFVRCVSVTPVMVAYCMGAAHFRGAPHWHGAWFGIFSPALLLCCQPLIDCFKLSQSTNDSRRILMWILWLGGCLVVFSAGAIVVFVPSLIWQSLGLACFAVTSGAMWLGYRAAYHRGVFDVNLKPPSG